METSPEVWDAAGRADPGTGHHHHAPTFLLPEQLGHILQGELLLVLVTSPAVPKGSGSRAQREGPGALDPAWHRGKHSTERTDSDFSSGGENHPKFQRKLFSGKDCAWASLGECLAVSLTQTLEQTCPSAIPYVDLKLPNHQYSCERVFWTGMDTRLDPLGITILTVDLDSSGIQETLLCPEINKFLSG